MFSRWRATSAEADIFDGNFWKRYVPRFNSKSSMPIRTNGHHHFIVNDGRKPRHIKSMLSIYDVAVLYALARDYYSGVGDIVDLGPLLGMSSCALARGVIDNGRVRTKRGRIHSFDLFMPQGYEHFLEAGHRQPGGSLFPLWVDFNRPYLDQLRAYPGDLLRMGWDGRPVEIIFIDIAKSWDLNDFILRQFFPALIAGRSVVVQQDFIHYYEYWIHLVMEYFADHFELLHLMYGATAVYLYTKTIPVAALNTSLRGLSTAEKSALLERARAKAPPPVREIMKLAHARCLQDCGELGAATEMWRSVDLDVPCEDPTLPLKGALRHNSRAVASMLGIA